ncbi:MAG: DNA repair and recombination protein RadA [Candidatus Lokiarchaeota archaeon]|nr:DNA repair and recombination protein RadA [Candidatus Lokiarchaeota archaeon]
MSEENEKKEKIKKFSNKLGIGVSTGRLLWNANYRRHEQIATLTVSELMKIIDVNKTFAGKIIAKARKACGMGFIPADILYSRRKEIDRITTGSNSLDGLLGGGVETGSITEFYGPFKSGKTQIVHQLAVDVQLSKDVGGLKGDALYIDSENTFRPERIVSMALAMKLEPQETLKKIRVARAYNSEHQIELVNKIENIFEESNNVRLLIVDSITTHFRSEYIGMSTLHERQQKLNKHLHSLERLADVYNCAVVITNQVLEDPSVIMGDPIKAVGGNIIAHLCQTRVYLRVSRGNKRLARLIDSPVLPEGEVEFKITNDGILDV